MSAPTVSPTSESLPAPSRPAQPLELLLELIRRARASESSTALRFIAVNDSHLLTPYQQSALWLQDGGVVALSGLVEIDANAPYVQWLQKLLREVAGAPVRMLVAADFSPELADEWPQWLPPHVLWVPFGRGRVHATAGGLLLARHLPWRDLDARLLSEWLETWACIHSSVTRPTLAGRVRTRVRRVPTMLRRRPLLWATAAVALGLCPVRLSVLVPGELVPAQPVAVRAPLDGIIKAFHVRTNERVNADQPLFTYDEAALTSRIDVALEAWRTAEAEDRQLSQQALTDPRARAALSTARGHLEEKRLELEYLRAQLERGTVTASREGVAFVDNPADWIGRPVIAGERIMRLAEPEDKEIEAWIPASDAIELSERAPVRLYLNANPLSPAAGYLRFVSYEPIRRPDGHYAYRVRATLATPTEHRVGLKGTVRISGERVALGYWMLRRPLAAVREFFGR
jgi:hypothetical protein